MDIVEAILNDVSLWLWGSRSSLHYLYILTFHILLITNKRQILFYAELFQFNVLAQYLKWRILANRQRVCTLAIYNKTQSWKKIFVKTHCQVIQFLMILKFSKLINFFSTKGSEKLKIYNQKGLKDFSNFRVMKISSSRCSWDHQLRTTLFTLYFDRCIFSGYFRRSISHVYVNQMENFVISKF